MKITQLEVANYRSIVNKSKLPLYDLTILIGPNNEGKSNLLRALVTAIRILAAGHYYALRRGAFSTIRYGYREPDQYDWENDYPLPLQQSNATGTSDFSLTFELSSSERDDFRKATGIRVGGPLILKLRLGREGALFDVSLRGPAKRRLNQKRLEIARFLRDHLDYQYIPAVRISDLSERLVGTMLANELAALEKDNEYSEVLEKLRNLQRPVLDSLGQSLSQTVKAFVPEVQEIRIENREALGHAVRRGATVVVDDGTPTPLNQKGDGVQSLVAMAIMRHVAQTSAGQKSLLLAIEEPEAHLHPDAIHRLRRVIEDTTVSFQVVVTTHSPLLVERGFPNRNIIVRSARANPASSLAEVRDCLGVRLADNLTSAFLIVLVEGQPDERILRAWLPALQPKLSGHLRSGVLAFDQLLGSANLSYKATIYKKSLCNCHAVLDDDQSGRMAIDRAQQDGVVEPTEFHLLNCPGLRESEIEDLVEPSVYKEDLERTFGLSLDIPHFRNDNGKWSDRLCETFRVSGKVWNKGVEARCKTIVATAVERQPNQSLHPARQDAVVACAESLVRRLDHA